MPSVFIFGFLPHSSGKTVVSCALARGLFRRGLHVTTFKPRSGHNLWYQREIFLKCKEEGRLFCEDIAKLKEASRSHLSYEILNPVDALMSPLYAPSFLEQNALDRLYLLQPDTFMHLVAERYTVSRKDRIDNVLCINEEAGKRSVTIVDEDYLTRLKKRASRVISLHSLAGWNRVFNELGPASVRSCYRRVSEMFEYVIVEGFNDAVCPEPTIRHDIIIGVAPGVAAFYDAKRFYGLLDTMSELGKNPAALTAREIAEFLREKAITPIPALPEDCLMDYDKLSVRLSDLAAIVLKRLDSPE